MLGPIVFKMKIKKTFAKWKSDDEVNIPNYKNL
jgi:hypothetical protein